MPSIFDEIIKQGEGDYMDADSFYDPQYQGNMFIIDKALQMTGAERKRDEYVAGPLDNAILKLINSIPLE